MISFKHIFSIFSAVGLAQSAIYFHNKFGQYVLYAKDDGTSTSDLSTYTHIGNKTSNLTNGNLRIVPMNHTNNATTIPFHRHDNYTTNMMDSQFKNATRDMEENIPAETEIRSVEPAPNTSDTTEQEPTRGNKRRGKKNKKKDRKAPENEETGADADIDASENQDQNQNETSTEGAANTEMTTTKENTTQEEALPQLATSSEIPSSSTTLDIDPEAYLKLDNASKEALFYRYHHGQIKSLINMDSIMDWNRDRRSKGKYQQWLGNFKFATIPKDPDQNSLTKIPNVHSIRFFRHDGSLCRTAKAFHWYRNNTDNPPLPHILLARVNQDFGALSSNIRGKTATLFNIPKIWKQEGCTKEFVWDYLNHPDTLAVFTNQFQIYSHPKVFSLPLGLPGGGHGTLLGEMTAPLTYNRTQLLMVNAMERGMRVSVFRSVLNNFKQAGYNDIMNSYKMYGHDPNDSAMTTGKRYCDTDSVKRCYYREMKQSKFVLSPGGLGIDCYRNWEALYMGAIPVLEYRKNDGWFDKTLKDLPVAWVDDFANLTPEHLLKEYDRIVYQKPPTAYNYGKLTRQYWIQMANDIIEKRFGPQQSSNGTEPVASTGRQR